MTWHGTLAMAGTLLVASCFLGCKPQAVTASGAGFTPVEYEKTLCFGPCPAFLFEVLETGQCRLEITRPFREGALNSLEVGQYSAQMKESAEGWNARLQTVYLETRFAQLQDEYDNPRITDLPSTMVTLHGKRVRVRYNGPDLSTLYTVLDAAMESMEWHPISTENQ